MTSINEKTDFLALFEHRSGMMKHYYHLKTSGQLPVCYHIFLPQQKDPHLQRGVLHRHQPPHQEMQELQEKTFDERISKSVQPLIFT